MNLFPSFVIDRRRFYSQNSTHLFVLLSNNGARVRVNSNYVQLLLIGLCLGVTLGIAFIPLFDSFDCNNISSFMELPGPYNTNLLGSVDRRNSESIASKTFHEQSRSAKMRRPRFFSTELGLRKKLIAGIVLTDFIGQNHAAQAKSLGLLNVVTLPDKIKSMSAGINESDKNGRPGLDKSTYNRAALKAMKYLGGKVIDSYDYFFVSLDVFYINGRNVMNAVKQISISQDILWGAVEGTGCSLEKGFVLSRSLMRKLSSRIDRCFHSSVLSMSNNLKKCFQYALGSFDCSSLVQNQLYRSISGVDLNHIEDAMSIGPLSSPQDFYQLHMKITDIRLLEIGQETKKASMIIDEMIPNIPKGFDISHWPKGLSMPHKPLTRFDVLKWKYFTLNNIYPKNEHITEVALDGIDQLDIYSVVNASTQYLRDVLYGNKDSSITFQYGYRRFDETRGMECLLDFLDAEGQIHRVECHRPLSSIEVVPVPFVTENRRLTIVVPVTLNQYNQTDTFLNNYFDNSVDKKSNSVIILAIIVNDANMPEYRTSQLQSMKQLIAAHNSNQAKRDNGTNVSSDSLKVGYVVVNMRQFKTSNFAIALLDTLGGRVLSPNSAVLVVDSFIVLKDEFLNRVRMSTILNSQIFSPIPFVEYSPKISGHFNAKNDKLLGIHKTTGYFDSQHFGFVSFFVADYIAARKQSTLSALSEYATNHTGVSILPKLFLQRSQLHILRAPEPYLNVKFPRNILTNCIDEECFKTRWGSKAELAKIILQSSETDELKL